MVLIVEELDHSLQVSPEPYHTYTQVVIEDVILYIFGFSVVASQECNTLAFAGSTVIGCIRYNRGWGLVGGVI